MMNERFDQLVKSNAGFDAHQGVFYYEDEPSALKCLIAVHNTGRGPGVGGCRLWNYGCFEEAVNDVLRLSIGMTYKNAMAELPFGGGKAVILAPEPDRLDRQALFSAFGRAVEATGGSYCTAEDVGTGTEDMEIIRRHTGHIFGLADTSGDPSPFTAYGVYLSIKTSVEHHLGTESLHGIRVVVQGIGNVGHHLCGLLHDAGAKLIVSDVNQDRVAQCVEQYGAEDVAVDKVFDVEADVYAPCALGSTVTEETLDRLRVGIIAGGANNQLKTDELADWVREKGILYAPDYVVNAGGIINIACEEGGYDREKALRRVEEIAPRLRDIFVKSKQTGRSTLELAHEMTRKKFKPCIESEIACRPLEASVQTTAKSLVEAS